MECKPTDPNLSAVEQVKSIFANEPLLFGRWSYEGIECEDVSLKSYINVKHTKQQVWLPHTAGKYQAKKFRKVTCPLVERIVVAMMRKGRNNGKKMMATRIVKNALEIIHLLTGLNPIKVIVDAVANCGAREDSTRIGSGGTVKRQAVDISPLRRVNQAITLLTTGVRESSFRNIKSVSECLADELINAAKANSNSYAMKKKEETERVAVGNR